MSEIITFEDFSKIDLRIGTIIEVSDFPKAHKPAYILTIDFGLLGIKNHLHRLLLCIQKMIYWESRL